MNELNEAKNFVFRALLCLDELRALEPNGVYLRDAHRRLGCALSELSFAEFSPQIQDDAETMSRMYVAFFCFENSADRVRAGGHAVPAATVRRRYRTGLRNFFHLYEPLASTWRLYDEPRLVAARLEVQPLNVYDEHIWSIVTHQGTA